MSFLHWIISLITITWLITSCRQTNFPGKKQIPVEPTNTPLASNAETEEDITMEQPSYVIGAYYYPWYSPDRHWDSGYMGTPVLGEYDSANPDVINQHIKWATQYNVDFFAVSWWGINSFEDKVICDPFLDVIEKHDFHFAVLYESAGLLKLQNGKINLDNDATRQQLISDFTYLAETVFQHPKALKIEGRPVVFLYLTRTFSGNVEGALSEAKSAAIAQGSAEPFIIGDEVYWMYPDQERISHLDGVTAYNMHTSVPNIANGFAENVERQYRLWEKIAAEQGIAFIPNILPGFDDTAVRPEAKHPVIPRSVNLFSVQFNAAKELATSENGMLMITSWNEWHENTSIEPTKEEGTAYLEVLLNQTP